MSWVETQLSRILSRNFVHCDIGAGAPGMKEAWKSIRSLVRTISFEADKDRFSILKKKNNEKETVLNYAIYSSNNIAHFNIAKGPSRCSMLEPDMDFLEKFPDSEWFEIKETVPVETVTLDSLYETEKIMRPLDFIKIIVNGVEMDVLKGGEKALQEVLGIQLSIEFRALWKGEHSFGEIDHYLKEEIGLELQDLRKYYYKYPEGMRYGGKKGKLIFCDALYFREPEGVLDMCSNLSKEDACAKIHMACVMAVVYGYADYSLHLLSLSGIKEYISDENIDNLSRIIKKYFRGITLPDFKGKGRIAEIIAVVYSLFETHNGWKLNDRPLGNAKRFGVFF